MGEVIGAVGANVVAAFGDLGGATDFLKQKAIPLIILIVAAGVFFSANSGNHKKAMNTVGIVLVGLFVLALVVPDNAAAASNFLFNLA